jgi:hypothetical protein
VQLPRSFFCIFGVRFEKTRGNRMPEPNEVFVTRPELMGSVRDVIARARLAESYKSLKAQGQISWSSRVKPVGAKDRAMIAQAYESAVDSEQLPAEDSDRVLIAQAYRYLQQTQQLPVPAQDVIMCVQSSDAVTDFFETHGLSKCQEQVCSFMGIETAAARRRGARGRGGSRPSKSAHRRPTCKSLRPGKRGRRRGDAKKKK